MSQTPLQGRFTLWIAYQIARTYFESVSALHFKEDDFGVLTVQCDHTRVNLRPSEFGRDWAANIAEVILPRVVTEHDDAVR